MSTHAEAVRPVVEALVVGLVDDAAVFPPGNASVAAAVESYRHHRTEWYADAIGPLLVRSSQAAELVETARPGDDLRIGLVADEGLAGLVEGMRLLLDQDDRAGLAQVEIPLPEGHDPAAATRVLVDQLALTATAYVEVPRAGYEAALDVLADDGVERAKFRTGGTTAAAHPSETELAGFLHACAERRLPYKLTAGLHGALRTTTRDGFEQHGLVNVLAAVARAVEGAPADELAVVLAERTLDRLLPVLESCDIPAVRRSFVSFGCCGVTDPLDALVALGLLSRDGL